MVEEHDVSDNTPLSDRDLMEEMIMAIVDKPDAVRVEEREEGPNRTRLIIHADPADRGKVIGRQGRTIEAIRLFMAAAAAKAGRHVAVTLVEERKKRPTNLPRVTVESE